MLIRIFIDWKGFFRNDENKNELFLLLVSYIVLMVIFDDKELYIIFGESVLLFRMNLINLV